MYRPGCAAIVAKEEARKYGIDVMALQEVRWPGSGECRVAAEMGTILILKSKS